MFTNTRPLVATLTLLTLLAGLTACGGATKSLASPAGASAQPSTDVGTVGATGSDASTPSAIDLQAFATAWISYNMVQAVPPMQLTTGANGACPLGGSAAFDDAEKKETLSKCGSRQFPGHVYSGGFAVSDLSANADRSHVAAGIHTPTIAVADAASGSTEFTLEAGDIVSEVSDSEAGDHYFFSSPLLTFKAGTMSRYAIANAGSTSLDIVFVNGAPERTTNNLVFNASIGDKMWQVQVAAPVHESGTNRPDRGSLLITRIGGPKALTVTFGNANTLVLSGGEAGAARTLNWNDADLQGALAAGRQ